MPRHKKARSGKGPFGSGLKSRVTSFSAAAAWIPFPSPVLPAPNAVPGSAKGARKLPLEAAQRPEIHAFAPSKILVRFPVPAGAAVRARAAPRVADAPCTLAAGSLVTAGSEKREMRPPPVVAEASASVVRVIIRFAVLVASVLGAVVLPFSAVRSAGRMSLTAYVPFSGAYVHMTTVAFSDTRELIAAFPVP